MIKESYIVHTLVIFDTRSVTCEYYRHIVHKRGLHMECREQITHQYIHTYMHAHLLTLNHRIFLLQSVLVQAVKPALAVPLTPLSGLSGKRVATEYLSVGLYSCSQLQFLHNTLRLDRQADSLPNISTTYHFS